MLGGLSLLVPGLLTGDAGRTSSRELLVYSVTQEMMVLQTRRFTRTEIYEIDPGQTTGRLVFTDAGSGLLLLPIRPSGVRDQVMTAAGRRIFARGVEKREYPGGWYERPAGIYELASDCSNEYRKLFDLRGEQRLDRLIVDPAGRKIGNTNQIGVKTYLFLHDGDSGALLRTIDLSGLLRDGFVRNMGWTRDGTKLFLSIEAGDVHVTSYESYVQVGSCLMDETGSAWQRIPEMLLKPDDLDGFRQDQQLPAVLIDAIPAKHYLARILAWNTRQSGVEPGVFLFAVAPPSSTPRLYRLSETTGLYWFRPSPSGRFLAYTVRQR